MKVLRSGMSRGLLRPFKMVSLLLLLIKLTSENDIQSCACPDIEAVFQHHCPVPVLSLSSNIACSIIHLTLTYPHDFPTCIFFLVRVL